MNAMADGNEGTTPVRPGYSFDETALIGWMKDHVPGFDGTLAVEQFKGGQSNPTYKLLTPTGNYVLRRKPPGQLLPGAHAVDREARVIGALHDADFPVPAVMGLCMDQSVIGTLFYVMEMVEGRVFWDVTLPDVKREDRSRYFDAMNATIAQLHGLNYQAMQLSDFGRPGNYFQRQIGRWSKQYLDDGEAGRDANMDKLVKWLPENIPQGADRSAIVHGDCRIDNMIFHPTEPQVIAVLDWELSTIGHPFADFAYNAMMYRLPPHMVAGLSGTDLSQLNIPTEAQYLAAYCSRLGLESMPGYDFYIAFNFFRLAAIFHGIKGRAIRGTASSAQAQERISILPELMDLAWQQAVRAGAR